MPGIYSHGTKLDVGDGATPEVFTPIDNCGDFDYTPPQPEEVDTTDHSSSAREHIDGLGADGELTTDIHFDAGKAAHVTLRGLHGVSDATNFRLRMPDSQKSMVSFAATVRTKFREPVGGVQVMALTLRISGAVTWGTWT